MAFNSNSAFYDACGFLPLSCGARTAIGEFDICEAWYLTALVLGIWNFRVVLDDSDVRDDTDVCNVYWYVFIMIVSSVVSLRIVVGVVLGYKRLGTDLRRYRNPSCSAISDHPISD